MGQYCPGIDKNAVLALVKDSVLFTGMTWEGTSRERYANGVLFTIDTFCNDGNKGPLDLFFAYKGLKENPRAWTDKLIACVNARNTVCIAEMVGIIVNNRYPFIGTAEIPFTRINKVVTVGESVTLDATRYNVKVGESPQPLEETLRVVDDIRTVVNGMYVFRGKNAGIARIMLDYRVGTGPLTKVLLTIEVMPIGPGRPTIGQAGVGTGFTPVFSPVAIQTATPYPEPSEEQAEPPAQPPGPDDPEETGTVAPEEVSDTDTVTATVTVVPSTTKKRGIGIGLGIAGGAVGIAAVIAVIVVVIMKRKKEIG